MSEKEKFAFFTDWDAEAYQSYTHVESCTASDSLHQNPIVLTLKSFYPILFIRPENID